VTVLALHDAILANGGGIEPLSVDTGRPASTTDMNPPDTAQRLFADTS
jgi:hypothetical protein